MHRRPAAARSAALTRFAARSVAAAATAFAAAAAAQGRPAEPLRAAAGWTAHAIHRADSGVWYAHVAQVVPAFGQPEVIAADDKGRLVVLSVYSGQWTEHAVVGDGLWLAPSRPADVDQRIAGRELYAAGRAGSVHQITMRAQPFARFTLEAREIAHVAGEEFHAIVAADLLPGGADELVVFGVTGAAYLVVPDGEHPGFRAQRIADLPGRVRDVAAVPAAAAGEPPHLLGVSRSGHLLRLRLTAQGLAHETLLHEDCGLGRIALGPAPEVAYVTRDDGVVLRLTIRGRDVDRQVIYAGPEGLRGIAAGRFFTDDREALAIYGYDGEVRLLHRAPAAAWFAVDTIFRGAQRGHWLASGELDGRNRTDELIATGFDGLVVLLAREPGYGLPGAAVPARGGAPATAASDPPPLRVAARIGDRALTELWPLNYQGGFESKTLVYETLVRRGADGRIAADLATSWRRERDGRVFVFSLREGATWHDGQPVTAADVAVHIRRWAGMPEHGWLPSSDLIRQVTAIGPRELRIELERPAALLADLCAINPTAVVGPSARTRQGDYQRAVGSGRYTFLGASEDGAALRYRRYPDGPLLELVRCADDALDRLQRGEVDVVVSSWLVDVEPARAAALRRDERFTVTAGPGSSVWYLALRWHAGPLADLGRRQAVAAAIDRGELVRVALHGLAAPCTAYAAPSIADWPAGRAVTPPGNVEFAAPLRFVRRAADAQLADVIAAQLRRAGIPVDTIDMPAGVRREADGGSHADLMLQRTHGVPYDPFTVVGRFGRPPAPADAAAGPPEPRDPALAAAVAALAGEADETRWPQHYAAIQKRLDELLPIVPLFAPHRLAIARRGIAVGPLDHDLYRLPDDLQRTAPPAGR